MASMNLAMESSGTPAVRPSTAAGPQDEAAVSPSRLRAIVKVMRPHQWAKNGLVVLPVLLAPGVPSRHQLVSAVIAAFAFSLCASAGYVFNDLIDVEADRAHPTKRRRPFASGALPLSYGPFIFAVLMILSFGMAYAFLPLAFVGMLAIYFVTTLAYSFALKSKLMVDVVVLAWLYTHRVLSGGIATGIPSAPGCSRSRCSCFRASRS